MYLLTPSCFLVVEASPVEIQSRSDSLLLDYVCGCNIQARCIYVLLETYHLIPSGKVTLHSHWKEMNYNDLFKLSYCILATLLFLMLTFQENLLI